MPRIKVFIDPELQPIMGRYLEIRREELGRLETAIGDGDGAAVRLLGHKLKGTGAAYGFDLLSEWGADIEIAGETGDMLQAGKLAEEVRHFIENVDIVYGE